MMSIMNLISTEVEAREAVLKLESFEAIRLEMMHMVCVEMFQRVLVHRLSRIAFRRIKRRARKSKASMARAAQRAMMNGICNSQFDFVLRMENDNMSDDGSDNESIVPAVPKIIIPRKERQGSVSSIESVGHEDCHSDSASVGRSRPTSPSYTHSPYTYNAYCYVTVEQDGTVVPNDSLVQGHSCHRSSPTTPSTGSNSDYEYNDEDFPLCDQQFLDVPRNGTAIQRTCNHYQGWKRLRHKRGVSYFVCTTCGKRWRKMNASPKCEFEYTQQQVQQFMMMQYANCYYPAMQLAMQQQQPQSYYQSNNANMNCMPRFV